MTLTFELIRDIIKVNASTKFRVCMSNGSAVRAFTDTHTHTDGTDFIPSTATQEGKMLICLCTFPQNQLDIRLVGINFVVPGGGFQVV